MANRINEILTNFHDHMLTASWVEHNGGWCDELDEDKEVGTGRLGDCKGNTYGQDDRYKSSVYFVASVKSEAITSRLFQHTLSLTVKLFYNVKKYGKDHVHFDHYLKMEEHLRLKYKNNLKSGIISSKNPRMTASFIVEIPTYADCPITLENNPELCA